MANRLKELRLNKGLTLKQVADAIGVSEATAQRYESGKISSLKYEKAEALAKLYNVSPGFLMGWDLDFKSFDDTPEGWTQKDQEFFFNYIQKYGERALVEQMDDSAPIYEAAAGEGRINDGYPTEEYDLRLKPDQILFEVKGRSMEPTLLDGDVVVISAQSVIDHPRQIALVKVNGEESTLKRVEIKENGLLLLADNVDVYAPHFFTQDEVEKLPVTILGVVDKLIRSM